MAIAVAVAVAVAIPAAAEPLPAGPTPAASSVLLPGTVELTVPAERASALPPGSRVLDDPQLAALGLRRVRIPAGVADLVLGAERPVPVTAAATPDDPGFSQQPFATVGFPAAWDRTRGGGVTVAVIDTGISAGHPDLAGKLWTNPAERADGRDDDGDGYVDDLNGVDIVNHDGDPTDDHGHGTGVAGVVAAVTDNGSGVTGGCWSCRVMPVKALDATGNGYDTDIAAGVVWAVDHGADVVNLSLGGPVGSRALASAIAYAESHGVVVVAAAGNAGTTTVTYPADYPTVLSVAATSTDGTTRASYSSYGSWVDVAAPGTTLTTMLTTASFNPTHRLYGTMQGTSLATPVVSAGAALARAAAPDLSPAAIRDAATATALPLHFVASGLVQIGAWLAQVAPAGTGSAPAGTTPVPAPSPSPSPSPSPLSSPTVSPAPSPVVLPAPSPSPTPSPSPSVTGSDPATLACPAGAVPPSGFDDVTVGSTHSDAIACAVWQGLTAGYGDGTYRPGDDVTRGQMATFLVRLLAAAGHPLAAAPNPFVDTLSSGHATDIAKLAAVGIASGVSADHFAPGAPVSRAQMASFLVRTVTFLGGAPLTIGPVPFSDIDGSVHHDAIAAAAGAGIASGVGSDRFAPDEHVNRAQMATFLVRTLGVLIGRGVAPDPSA